MAKFNVGDRARVISLRDGAPNIHGVKVGDVVEIHAVGAGEVNGFQYEYSVKVGRHFIAHCMGWQLEPLTPDLGSWDEIERLTKWKPQWVTA